MRDLTIFTAATCNGTAEDSASYTDLMEVAQTFCPGAVRTEGSLAGYTFVPFLESLAP